MTFDLATGDSSSLEIAEHRAELYRYDRTDGRQGFFDLPFAPWQVWTPGPDGGYAIAWGGDYRIFIVDAM